MGNGYAGLDYWGRQIGYEIEATCDRRGCETEIDRGLGYLCGDLPHRPFDAQPGCSMYFCGEHDTLIGSRGGCRHRQTKPYGKTKCQLLVEEGDPIGLTPDGSYEFEAPRVFCACMEWEYGGPAIEDPLFDYRLVPGFLEHVDRRGFASPMESRQEEQQRLQVGEFTEGMEIFMPVEA